MRLLPIKTRQTPSPSRHKLFQKAGHQQPHGFSAVTFRTLCLLFRSLSFSFMVLWLSLPYFFPLQPPPFPYEGFIGRMMPPYTSPWSFSTWTTGEPFVTGSRLQAWLPQLPLYRCQAGAWGLYQQHLTHQCTTAERSTQNREELPPN